MTLTYNPDYVFTGHNHPAGATDYTFCGSSDAQLSKADAASFKFAMKRRGYENAVYCRVLIDGATGWYCWGVK